MRAVNIDDHGLSTAPSLVDLDPFVTTLDSLLAGSSVALVQEWVAARAGSEKVFEALARLLPEADLFALTVQPEVSLATGGRHIAASWMDRPFLRDRRDLMLPLMPLAWKTLGSRRYDVVVTSAHALARTFARRATFHFSYVHSPARYLWFPDVDTRSAPWRRPIEAPARSVLKRVDRSSTRRTESLAANSRTTRDRIAEVYERDVQIIHPPVDVRFFEPAAGDRHDDGFLLAVSRFVPYKRLDLAMAVAAEIGRPLVLAGDGPDRTRLEQLARSSLADVTIVRAPSDEQLRELYRRASALLFFAHEDFGMIPVEAQACGCPIVTCGTGGVLETVVDGVTGAHASGSDVASLTAATRRVLEHPGMAGACRENALRFSYAAFGDGVTNWIRGGLG